MRDQNRGMTLITLLTGNLIMIVVNILLLDRISHPLEIDKEWINDVTPTGTLEYDMI